MNNCEECIFKGSLGCSQWECEERLALLNEHDKKVKAEVIKEFIKHIKLYEYNIGTYVVYDESLDEIAEQLKGE